MTGRVLRITPSTVTVRLDDGRVVTTRNALAARTPPGSRVIVLTTDTGAHDLVGRTR